MGVVQAGARERGGSLNNVSILFRLSGRAFASSRRLASSSASTSAPVALSRKSVRASRPDVSADIAATRAFAASVAPSPAPSPSPVPCTSSWPRDSPAAARVLAFGMTDGANESADYANRWYTPANPPLLPVLPGNPDLVNWNQWQPLALAFFVDQAGNPILGGYPDFLSPEWGGVVPFGLSPIDRSLRQRSGYSWTVWMDPGAPPLTHAPTTSA